MPTSSDLANWTKWWFLGRGRGWLSWLRWSNKTIWQCQVKYWPCQTKEFIILPAFGLRETPTSSSKTVNPLDPRRKFCQYWPRECNLTADFWFFWVFAPSNHPITELEPLSTNLIPGLLSLGTFKSANHRAGTTINQSDSGSAGKVGPEENSTYQTVKIASP